MTEVLVTRMNSFETDMGRAVLSRSFGAAVLLQTIVLLTAGFDSDLFRICVPILCTFPYSTAWLEDYQSGFIKNYLPRTGITAYIYGKILACGISGGGAELLGCFIYIWIKQDEAVSWSPKLIFISGMLWAMAAAVLAAVSLSRYIAYGGAFVIYYVLVILHERYFKILYCLYPYEWISPTHTWIFGEWGVVFLLTGMILVLISLYSMILRRYMENV